MTQPKLRGLPAPIALVVLTLLFFWKILLTNLILSGVDVFLYFYPYKTYVAEALRQGHLPLWNPHLFMGVPLLANSQVGLFYPLNWLFIWLDAPKQVAWSIGLHIALAGGLMLAFARRSLRLARPAALVAAILFAFGGYLGAQVEHINQLQAAAWLPLLFLLYDLGLKHKQRWRWTLFLALTIALTLLAGHAQTVFISLFGLGLYALWQAITESTDDKPFYDPQHIKRLTHHVSRLTHHLWPLAFASVLAVALAAIQLLPTAELSALSIRSGGLTLQEVVSFSLRPSTLHYSLLPPINVDLTQIMGQAFSEWVAYLGVSGLILALLGALIAIWRPAARRFVFLSGSGLALSLGLYSGPLYVALYKLAPGFNLFRVPARWLLLYTFGMAVLGGFGFQALLTPNILSDRLVSTWRRLRAGRNWRLLLPITPIIFLLILIIWKTPPITTLIIWLALVIITISLIFYVITPQHLHFVREYWREKEKLEIDGDSTPLNPPYKGGSKLLPLAGGGWEGVESPSKLNLERLSSRLWGTTPQVPWPAAHILIILLLITELFWTAQILNYNQPTAPQAYHSMRNATAFLLAADPPNHNSPPDRFLSLSGITYDPGDLSDMQHLYGDRLSEKALYNLVVAAKEKEVLFFNLPLIYGLHSVDGYDGGVLPLTQFITLQQLFLSPDDLSTDGRLREKLHFVPPGRLLSLLNTRWIITDKMFDAWIDGIFYDLQFPAQLGPAQTIATTDIPTFSATTIGLVSHLEGAASLPTGSPVAKVTLTFADGSRDTFTLKAGLDTAEGSYPAGAGIAHTQATIGVTWPYAADGVDYISLRTLATSQQIADISVKATLPAGQFVLRGLSLIHQPTTTSRSIILSTEGAYRQVHSGDVKVYENLAVLPRTFIVHQIKRVPTEEQAIAVIKNPQFDPLEEAVRVTQDDQAPERMARGQPSLQDTATIVSYAPERVEIVTNPDSPGWLVLTDTYYPGWQATVDGQPVEILPVNILFRAIEVPGGEHTVIFKFKPDTFQWGMLISGVTLLGLVIGLVVAGNRLSVTSDQ